MKKEILLDAEEIIKMLKDCSYLEQSKIKYINFNEMLDKLK